LGGIHKRSAPDRRQQGQSTDQGKQYDIVFLFHPLILAKLIVQGQVKPQPVFCPENNPCRRKHLTYSDRFLFVFFAKGWKLRKFTALYLLPALVLAALAACRTGVTTPGEDERENKMVFVAGGNFVMGSNDLDAEHSQQPAHAVRVGDFFLSRFEITQREYLAVYGSNPSANQNPEHPVERVSWADAARFCNLRSIAEGLQPAYRMRGSPDPFAWGWNDSAIHDSLECDFDANGYRLPTEAEWNWAALGGMMSMGYQYSGSNIISQVCWYMGSAANASHPVGMLNPNELGIHDLSGNVWELCWDRFGQYGSGGEQDPQGPGTGGFRVLRGGSWLSASGLCKVRYRSSIAPGYKNLHIGFRVARSCL
jgi:formylglycine-generating enzyme required for sulfatase activity